MNRYGKVAVLMGGDSAEREVSLNSGNAVLKALVAMGVDAHCVDPRDDLIAQFHNQGFDRAFVVLHGGLGENGAIQGFLESIGLPHTGCGVLPSAIAMDKIMSKSLFLMAGLPVLVHKEVTHVSQGDNAIEEFGLPVAVKPTNEGSSIGVSKVTLAEEFPAAFDLAKKYSDVVIVEPWVPGKELSIPVFEEEVFPIVDIQTPEREFYDYQAKTGDPNTVFICPAVLDKELTREIEEVALKAYRLLGCSGLARVDFKLDENGRPWLFEINTTPGMTTCSLSPLSMRNAGVSFEVLIKKMLDQTLQEI